MTSPLEQKLKVKGPVVVTANRLRDGAVIYRTAAGDWSTDLSAAAVVVSRHVGKRAHLLGRQRAVRDADAQHVGVELQVDAVEQAQELELVLGQFAGQPPTNLVAELGHALVEKSPIEFIVDVHGSLSLGVRPSGRFSFPCRPCALRT